MTASTADPGPPVPAGLIERYGAADAEQAWQVLYATEPELYDRLIAGEHIHPDVLRQLPAAERCVEIAAGTGRLTAHLVRTCGSVIAIEPSVAMRTVLCDRFPGADVRDGTFAETGLDDACADLVVSCSAFTTALGGDDALAELERVAAPGGTVAFVWPSDVAWLQQRGYDYRCFDGDLAVSFPSLDEALELAGIFYPDSVASIARRGSAEVPYEVLGMNAPRDIALKVMA